MSRAVHQRGESAQAGELQAQAHLHQGLDGAILGHGHSDAQRLEGCLCNPGGNHATLDLRSHQGCEQVADGGDIMTGQHC